jgi:hypothetical protein
MATAKTPTNYQLTCALDNKRLAAHKLMKKIDALAEASRNTPEPTCAQDHIDSEYLYRDGGDLGRELISMLAENPGCIGVKLSDAEVELMKQITGVIVDSSAGAWAVTERIPNG